MTGGAEQEVNVAGVGRESGVGAEPFRGGGAWRRCAATAGAGAVVACARHSAPPLGPANAASTDVTALPPRRRGRRGRQRERLGGRAFVCLQCNGRTRPPIAFEGATRSPIRGAGGQGT